MRRALGLLAVLALAVAAAWQLRQFGGVVEIRAGDWFLSAQLPVLVALIVALFVALLLLIALLRWLGEIPARRRAAREARARAEGDGAITRALVALAAGAGGRARTEIRKARRALGDTPQILLLTAEAGRAAGVPEEAEAAYKALVKGEARFLGLRGLLREAMNRGDWQEAQRLAREAEAAEPGAAWLRGERAALAIRMRDWREALALGAPDAPKAALALAAARAESNTQQATALERQAFEADPGFAPGALAYAERLRRQGDKRRARGVLEQSWAARPHPDVAEAYLAEAGDALGRAKAAEQLAGKKRQDPESRLLLARTALAASLSGRARGELDALLASGRADRRAYLAMAQLELLEQGEGPPGRAAEARWLREAATAVPEPVWRCGNCGAAHEHWAPECGTCGTVGRIAWPVPPNLPVVAG